MLKLFSYILVLLLINGYTSVSAQTKKILVFSKTAGYYHKSIPHGIAALQKMGEENNFIVDTTKNADLFHAENLKNYAAIVFLNTTGDVLNPEQQAAFEKYIQGGGGFAGIHAATDTEYGWPWFGRMIGAYFINHPKIQEANLSVLKRNTIATKHLPKVWRHKDEWYNFKDISSDIQVLMNLEENSYTGGKNGKHHPIAWFHTFEGGRVFYTGLGHVNEAYTDPLFLKHLLGGLLYAMGTKSMK